MVIYFRIIVLLLLEHQYSLYVWRKLFTHSNKYPVYIQYYGAILQTAFFSMSWFPAKIHSCTEKAASSLEIPN